MDTLSFYSTEVIWVDAIDSGVGGVPTSFELGTTSFFDFFTEYFLLRTLLDSERFLNSLIVIQYTISAAETKLNPMPSPNKPPICEMKSVMVIRKLLLNCKIVDLSK